MGSKGPGEADLRLLLRPQWRQRHINAAQRILHGHLSLQQAEPCLSSMGCSAFIGLLRILYRSLSFSQQEESLCKAESGISSRRLWIDCRVMAAEEVIG